ncbi:NADPH:quinone oxidoreductase family protein [Nocardioides acrostichi]|uniref:NADPH:quinone oxidoreductase family protein n=1 Tax=Nocardioides acrostichi TaxID=2784339 RepID=A0A930V2Q3_9ACTN|nr:NADPH:quinone oxidoreductase family protein [Nocardioides acrostichi]MBF4162707.1 NADPH:quinone oxidoreductase family protein [Nocardioides acrostichi]
MRAQVLESLTGPTGLRLVDLPDPEPDGERVILDVTTTGVSFPEMLYTYGRYQDRRPPPFVPGVEACGVVSYAPPGAPVGVGDRVVAAPFFGAWAEKVAVRPEFVAPLPAGLDVAQGGAFVLNHHTAHLCLVRRGRLEPGETVLVHGAAGGLGSAALQVAIGRGARAIALVSTQQKADVARRAGATDVVVLTEAWRSDVHDLTDGRGVDVVFDVVGDRVVDSLRLLRREGRLVVAGFAAGEIPTVKVNRLLMNNIDVVGAAWGEYVLAEPSLFAHTAAALDDMVASGAVSPWVGARFALDDAATALRAFEDRSALGKIVLEV